MEKVGIKELSEAVVFGLNNAKAVAEALKDGFDVTDIFKLLPVLVAAPEAFEGIAKIPAELADLSDEEVAALIELVKTNLGEMENEKAKAIAFKALQLALVSVQMLFIIKG